MEHDITAYILPPKQSPLLCTKELPVDCYTAVAHYRIGDYNATRQHMFYSTLPKPFTNTIRRRENDVDGDGAGYQLIFTIDDITNALKFANNLFKFDEMLTAVQQVDSWDVEMTELQQKRESQLHNLVDICKFHQDIIDAYDFFNYIGQCQIVISFH